MGMVDRRGGDAFLLHHLFLQHAIDPLADAQDRLVRFDVDVGGADLHGVLEQTLQQLDDGRVGHVLGLDQARQIDVALAQFLVQFLGEGGDFLGSTVDLVDGREQIRLAHHRLLDVGLELPGEFVVGEDVGGIGHADQQAAIGIALEGDGPVAAGQGLRDQTDRFRIVLIVAQVHEGHAQLFGEHLQQAILAEEAQLDEGAAQFLAGALLGGEGLHQLVVADHTAFHQQIAEADFLAWSRGLLISWRRR